MLWTWAEKRFVFFPESEVNDTPAHAGLRYEEVYLTAPDGVKLHGWFLPAPDDTVGPETQIWLWFHGNGGNLGTRVGQLERGHRLLGVHQFIFDYRGYGRSEGKPSEQGTYLDARAARQYLEQRADVDSSRIVYFGHSLGAAVAVELAVYHPPAGMALIAPFSSIRDMAKLALPLPLAGWIVRNHYNSVALIPKVHAPLVILHGELDEIVPHSQGVKLFEAANPPKRFVTLPVASHNNAHHVAADVMARALLEFRDGLAAGNGAWLHPADDFGLNVQ